MKKKILVIVLIMLMIVSAVIPTNYVQAAVKINKTKKTMYVGDKLQLNITGTSKKITWTSSKKSVATVSSKGKVVAKKKGTVTITAKVSGKSYQCNITIKSATRTLKIPTESYNEDSILLGFLDQIEVISTTTSGDYTLIKCNAKSLDKRLKQLKEDIDKAIAELIDCGALSEVTYSKDYTKLTVKEAREMTDEESLNMIGLYLGFPYVQVLRGDDYEKVDVYVTTYDKDGTITYEGYLINAEEN